MHKPNRRQSLLFDVTLCGVVRGKIEITTALGAFDYASERKDDKRNRQKQLRVVGGK